MNLLSYLHCAFWYDQERIANGKTLTPISPAANVQQLDDEVKSKVGNNFKFKKPSLRLFRIMLILRKYLRKKQFRFVNVSRESYVTQHILDSASSAEAEMAATATACIIAALDHSNAQQIKLTIDVGADGEALPELIVPPRALRFFADVLRQMAKREPMVLVPQKCELTTQEAAAFLNVSRPFVIKEINEGRLNCRLVNNHRRIEFEELVRYQNEQKKRSEEALRKIREYSDEIGEEL